MSDRAPPQVIQPGPARGARAAAAAAANTAGVRRNLFQHQLLSRRPTPPISSNASANANSNHAHAATTTGIGAVSTASTSAETLRLDADVDVLSDNDDDYDGGFGVDIGGGRRGISNGNGNGNGNRNSSEIVVRDRNGEFEVGNPPTPPFDDGADEGPGGGAGGLDEAQENEREHPSLATLLQCASAPEEEKKILARVVSLHGWI